MTDAKRAKPVGDVTAQRVARVYAEALLNAADKQGAGEGILDEYRSLVDDVLASNPDVETLLFSAALGRTKREEALEKMLANRASPLFANFLLVLNRHERFELLRPILVALQELHDERARRIRVYLQSAVPLEGDQHKRIEEAVRRRFGLEPILVSETDANMLGGLKVRVGDWQFDGSLRTKVESIRSEILERSSHEIQSRRDRFSTANGN
jgi:F-type H+-transporting ATPase subunit delta